MIITFTNVDSHFERKNLKNEWLILAILGFVYIVVIQFESKLELIYQKPWVYLVNDFLATQKMALLARNWD